MEVLSLSTVLRLAGKARTAVYSSSLGVIARELEEMRCNPSNDFKCLPLPGSLYDWQFAIRGPNGTEFEGGIYHGRIQFSVEYPDKLPIFTLLTKNGRFKTTTRIWLDKSNVRDNLLKLIELFPKSPGNRMKRRALAMNSRVITPEGGTAENQQLIDEIHEYMLSVPSNTGGDIEDNILISQIHEYMHSVPSNTGA